MLSYHIQKELNPKLFAEVLPVPGHEGGHILDVTNLQVELGPRPDPKDRLDEPGSSWAGLWINIHFLRIRIQLKQIYEKLPDRYF